MAFHRRHGTTTLVASLVTAGPAELLRQVTELADDVRAGLIDGIHLEGPWLSTKRCGAHQPSLMRDPDPAEIDRVLDAGGGAIRMVTIAPERDGALAAIGRIVDAGVVAAVGHTEATYEQTRAAIAAGATVGTHLFNAMRPINTREPGPVIALLEDSRVTVELITDGVHVDPALYRHVCAQRGTGPGVVDDRRDGRGRDGRRGTITSGRWRWTSSTEWRAWRERTPSQAAPRPWTTSSDSPSTTAGCSRDEALMAAVRQASINPARALGLPCTGLVPGRAADLVVLDCRPRRDGCAAPRIVGRLASRRVLDDDLARRLVESTDQGREGELEGVDHVHVQRLQIPLRQDRHDAAFAQLGGADDLSGHHADAESLQDVLLAHLKVVGARPHQGRQLVMSAM